MVYQDLERVGSDLYKVRSTTKQSGSRIDGNPEPFKNGAGRVPSVDRSPTLRSVQAPLPGTRATADELASLGFTALDLRVLRVDVVVASGTGVDWDTVGNVPKSKGICAFTVEDLDSIRVTYEGLTKHLWMVTKDRHPDGRARGGQRYGRPKHAGVTRERINVLAAEAIRAGHTVRHWIQPLVVSTTRDLRSQLLRVEESPIDRWDLRTEGWNLG